MVKAVIIYAHPNPASFNHAIKETVEAELRKKNIEFTTRDLYVMKFNPVLAGPDFEALKTGTALPDVAAEQTLIKEADLIFVVAPTWWTSHPALLIGYFDRVLSYGFAYKMENGVVPLLSGKRCLWISTTGTPEQHYKNIGMLDALVKTSNVGVMEFCGIQMIDHLYFCGIPSSSPEDRAKYLEKVKLTVSGIN